jgi:hypothetical protein
MNDKNIKPGLFWEKEPFKQRVKEEGDGGKDQILYMHIWKYNNEIC